MDAYSSSYSSSKSSYLSQNPGEAKGMKHVCPFQSQSSLHSVRKSPSKSWKKAPVAPMPPTPAKVYKVDAINFRDLVQQLTCAPEFMPPQPRHHQLLQSIERAATATTSLDDVPSLPVQNLSSRDTAAASPPPLTVSTNNRYFQPEDFGMNSKDGAMTPGLLEMNLFSPTFYGNWCFFPPVSPRM